MGVAEHMHKVTTYSCFVHAHLTSQVQLVKYFGGNGKIDSDDEAELARCIMQSQIAVYKVLLASFEAKRQLDEQLLWELELAYQRKTITEGLEEFVMMVYRAGAISSREAESILHPLHTQIHQCTNYMHHLDDGITNMH